MGMEWSQWKKRPRRESSLDEDVRLLSDVIP